MAQRTFEGMNSWALLAVPLYTFAGYTMSKGGVSKNLMDFCYSIVGHIYGGLAHVNVFASMIFAGISGSAVADTAGVSGMFMPQMVKKGYSTELSVAVTGVSSTIGIIKVDRAEDWEAALDTAFQYDSVLLVEQFVRGTELTVPVVHDQVLPAIEIRSPHGFYDYDAKYVYKEGKTEYFCPAPSLSPEQTQELAAVTMRFFKEFGCRDILRVDFLMDEHGKFYILEGNSIPAKMERIVGELIIRCSCALPCHLQRREEAASGAELL